MPSPLNWEQSQNGAYSGQDIRQGETGNFGSCPRWRESGTVPMTCLCVCVLAQKGVLMIGIPLSGLCHLVPRAHLAPALTICRPSYKSRQTGCSCVFTLLFYMMVNYQTQSLMTQTCRKKDSPTNSGVPKMFLKSLPKSILWARPKSMILMRGWGTERFSSMMFSG